MNNNNIKPIDVRKIFMLPRKEISKLRKNLFLKFDDGVVAYCRYKDIIIFRYLLDFINDVDFDINITYNLFPSNHYEGKYFTNNTYISIYSILFEQVSKDELKMLGTNKRKNILFKKMYEAINEVNRELVGELIEYALSTDIEEILEIQFDPDLISSMIEAADNPSPYTIENTYNTLKKIMEERYEGNGTRLLYLSGAASRDQINQLLASRGYLTELNSKIFNKPMTNSFTLGIKDVYDLIIESRAGAKALYLSTTAIQESEYLARGVQLLSMVVRQLHTGDCGHPTYVDFYVKPKERDEFGTVIHNGYLDGLIGKRYLDEDGKEKIITKYDTHLEGKMIKLRESVYCGLRNKYKICSACLGEVSHSIADFENLGHITITNATAKFTQSLLSTKHLLKSAIVSKISLDKDVEKYFTIKKDNKLYLKANSIANAKTIKLYIKQNEFWGINIHNVLSVNPANISKITEIILEIETKTTKKTIPFNLVTKSKKPNISFELLTHIVRNGYEVPNEDYYLIDITNFKKQPLFVYEKTEFDFSALVNEFKHLVRDRNFKIVKGKIVSEYQPHVLLEKLYDLANSKLNINIALFEVMVYALTARDINVSNFDLGRNSTNRDLCTFRDAVNYRTLGSAYDWDNVQEKIFMPTLFKKDHKVEHPMDVFLMPQEVVNYVKRLKDEGSENEDNSN